MHPACSTSNVGCNEQRPPRPAPAAEGYAGQAAREPPVDLAACRACGPLSGTIVLDRGGGRMPAGRLLRRAHAREAVVQPAFDRIAVDVEHPQLVVGHDFVQAVLGRSEEHTSELQSLMRISYAVFCLKKKTQPNTNH